MKKVINDDRVQIKPLANSKEPDPMTPVDSIFGVKIRNSIHRTLDGTNVSEYLPLFRGQIQIYFSVPSIFVALADSRWLLEFSDDIFRFNPLKMEKEEIKGRAPRTMI